jgi:hypothetical protein
MKSIFHSRRAALAGFGGIAASVVFGENAMAQSHQLPIRQSTMDGYLAAKQRYRARNDGSGVAVDFGLRSNLPRLHIIGADDIVKQSVLVGHGRGSALGHETIATRFDGPPGSYTSVLGALRGAERYVGKHKLSLRLDGLQRSNLTARNRLIVVHQADYMEDEFVAQFGKPGRSQGCFVLRQVDLEPVLRALEGGGILWAGQ